MALAERLIEKEVIDNDELRQIIEANSPSVMIVPGTNDPRTTNGGRAGRRKRRRRKWGEGFGVLDAMSHVCRGYVITGDICPRQA